MSQRAITDADILSRLTNVEDSTVERKTSSDYRDIVKAAVAFSNSMPVGEPALIYIGVYDDGRVEDIPREFDHLLKKVSGEISNVYPPILPQILVREREGIKFIAVIVYGSEDRPHFAGKSYIRDGTQSREASASQFQELIDRRSRKSNEILKWVGVLIRVDLLDVEENIRRSGRVQSTRYKKVLACNQFFVTLEGDEAPKVEAIPLRRVELSHDYVRNCLILEVYQL